MSLSSRYVLAAVVFLGATSVAQGQASPWRDSKELRVPDSTSVGSPRLGPSRAEPQSLPPLLAVRPKSDVNRVDEDARPSCAMPVARNPDAGRDSMPVARRGATMNDPMPVTPSRCRSGQ
jgi:hypothetical protein